MILSSEWHIYLIFPFFALLIWGLLTFSCMWDSHVYICIKFGHFLILSHVNLIIKLATKNLESFFLSHTGEVRELLLAEGCSAVH